MKKLFTLLTLLVALVTSAWADGEDLIVSWNTAPTTSNDSEGCSTTGTKKNLATWTDGTKVKIMRSDKDVTNGSNITIGSTSYKTIKVSNGAQNKLIMPSGKKAYAVSIYSYVNKDSGNTAWAEVNGDDSEKANYMTNFNNAGDPDVRFYEFDPSGISEFTFTNSGQQVCYVLVIYTAPKSASSLAFSVASGTYDMKDGTAIDLAVTTKTPAEASVTYKSSDATVATVNASTGAVTLLKAGTTKITASFAGNASYYPASATFDLTVVNSAVNTITVTYDASASGATGTAPAAFDINEGETFTVPVNQTLYKEGYTLTAWNDGSADHAIGSTVTAAATDITLTPIFTANTKNLSDNASEITWDFQTNNGAPTFALQGVGGTGLYIAQTTIGGVKTDVKLDIDATSGKLNNTAYGDWAQANSGTKLTIPVTDGAVVEAYVMGEGSTPVTFGGVNGSYASYIYSYTATADGDLDIVMGDQNWLRYVKVTYPSKSAVLTVAANNTEIGLTKANIDAVDYLNATTDSWQTNKTYGSYTGDFVNMSKAARYLTIKVTGASMFEVLVQNNTAGRTYLVKVGDNDAQEITHPGGGVKSSGLFAIADPSATTTITLSGGGSSANSVYPVAIKFNPAATATFAADKEYITFASSYALDCTTANLPAGLKAYKATGASASSVTIEEVNSTVNAGTGLLLQRTGDTSAAGNFDIPVVASGTNISATNKFVGVTAAAGAAIGGDGVYDYVLKDGKFYHASAGTLAQGKAYLHLDAAPSAPVLNIDFSGTTGINAVNGSEFKVNGEYYNLNGQRVANPTKGLYIVNGKKVVLK